MIANARDTRRIRRLVSGHFHDNPASGRVLAKLGFTAVGTERRYSAGRDADVPCRLFERELATEDATADSVAPAMAA